jgi:hypothetical protein
MMNSRASLILLTFLALTLEPRTYAADANAKSRETDRIDARRSNSNVQTLRRLEVKTDLSSDDSRVFSRPRAAGAENILEPRLDKEGALSKSNR